MVRAMQPPVAREQCAAAVDEAIMIAQREEAEWRPGIAMHAATAAAATGVAAAHRFGAGRVAAARQVEATRARRQARLAITNKEAWIKALEEAVAHEKAKKEAEKGAQKEALPRAKAEETRAAAINEMRRRIAKEWSKTAADLDTLEAEEARRGR